MIEIVNEFLALRHDLHHFVNKDIVVQCEPSSLLNRGTGYDNGPVRRIFIILFPALRDSVDENRMMGISPDLTFLVSHRVDKIVSIVVETEAFTSQSMAFSRCNHLLQELFVRSFFWFHSFERHSVLQCFLPGFMRRNKAEAVGS